jgi:hypothetical protein
MYMKQYNSQVWLPIVTNTNYIRTYWININIVTYTPIARQRLGKHNRVAVFYVVRSVTVAMQWCGKHA